MKYSIIVCYRNREEHLKQFVPAIRKHFANLEHEIIIVEQLNNFRFQRGALFNVGVQHNRNGEKDIIATGDILVFHDVDHIPSEETVYWPNKDKLDVFLPIQKVYYLDEFGNRKSDGQIPAGYVKFQNGVDEDYFGGVISFKREEFLRMNGFNPLYSGWGLEDADLRERVKSNGMRVQRSTNGLFFALDHKDSYPGNSDVGFQFNNTIFETRDLHKGLGVNTQRQVYCADNHNKRDKYGVDKWIEVSKPFANDIDFYCSNLDSVANSYVDTPEVHSFIWHSFKRMVYSTPELKEHRDWVVHNQWGYGNRAFHWLWNLLIDWAPIDFKMLEIGVFKGQTISLVSLLNKLYNKNGQVFGLTPLNKSGDYFCEHPDIDYEQAIATIYAKFGLDASDLSLIEGYSNQPEIIEKARTAGPFDIIYIDGCHDYDVVVSDIQHYSEMIKVGGYLIMDDASNDLKIPDGLIRLNWRGMEPVTKAVNDVLDKDSRFEMRFAVGHNKVYQRIS
jgi:hypothetical protein